MEFAKRIAGRYWGAYYCIYVAGIAGGAWRYQDRLAGDDGFLWLAAIFAVAAGCVSLVVIFVEAIGRMVLLIPAAWKKIKEQGIKEGREEGREAGRAEERQRILNEVAQLGDQVPPEVLKIVKAESENHS